MVLEVTGNRDVDTARVLRHIARALATHIGDLADHKQNSMLQEFCGMIGFLRIRAVLRRRSELADAKALPFVSLYFGFFSCRLFRVIIMMFVSEYRLCGWNFFFFCNIFVHIISNRFASNVSL